MRTVPSLHTVLRAVALVALLCVVALFVVQAVPSAVGADRSYTVLSGSMEPTIAPGDVVIVNSVGTERIEEGEIVTYRLAGSDVPTTHRVVGVERTDEGVTFRTKGDANEDVDPSRVPADALVGEVMFVIPHVGYVTRFADSRLGFVVMVGVPFALLVLNELVNVATAATSPATGATDDPVARTTDESPATAAEGSTARTDAPESDGVAVAPADLTLTTPVLVAFGGYSSYVAWQEPTGVSVGVAAATTSAALLVAALHYLAGRHPSPSPPTNAGTTPDGGVDVDDD
jgi:signal peptidase